MVRRGSCASVGGMYTAREGGMSWKTRPRGVIDNGTDSNSKNGDKDVLRKKFPKKKTEVADGLKALAIREVT